MISSTESEMAELRRRLASQQPQHDTPIGVVHPYWARKPMGTLTAIIESLSKEGDLVADPFMGSGTTLFAASMAGRRSVGSDISPMAWNLVAGTLQLIRHQAAILPELKRILRAHSSITAPMYAVGESELVERERFHVDGDFAFGEFSLRPAEVVTKQNIGEQWRRRRVYSDQETLQAISESRAAAPAAVDMSPDFTQKQLMSNARIAIPEGAIVGHYFTKRNAHSIRVLLNLFEASQLEKDLSPAIRLILSASLPLLRLSDKKASSQWPYWRPKTDLTSRNPMMVLDAKYRAIVQMTEWASATTNIASAAPAVFQIPAQELTSSVVGERPRLVLTDPPYGDQVPYGEYAELWNAVLNFRVDEKALASELVRSDSSHRRNDSAGYLARLREAFKANATLVHPEGYVVWYYQDQDLRCWEALYEAATECGFRMVDAIELPKQRRSLKTVTSPNRTLDGDLLCVFARGSRAEATAAPAVRPTGTTYFERYAALIRTAMIDGSIIELAKKYGSVPRMLAANGG